VGTVTEIYDYLRLLYARIGRLYCPNCKKKISQTSSQQIIEKILKIKEGVRFQILSPAVRQRKGEFKDLFERVRKDGFVRVKVDGKYFGMEEEIKLEKDFKHDIDVVIDRLIMKKGIKRRVADSVETALKVAEGIMAIEYEKNNEEKRELYNTHFSCSDCGFSLEELSPRIFSFNSPFGACPECSGLGIKLEVDQDLIITNKNLSIEEGALTPFFYTPDGWYQNIIESVCKDAGIKFDAPWKSLSKKAREKILYGYNKPVKVTYSSVTGRTGTYRTTYEGIIPNLERRHKETESELMREKIEQYMIAQPCKKCMGARLKRESLSVIINGLNISEFTRMTVKKSLVFINRIKLSKREMMIGGRVIKEIKERLEFLMNVGLYYLTLDRAANTLAGGEAQRIRLATQIGSGLTGVLYVLDEPSIGLHQRDLSRLVETLKNLRDLGNTLIVVEHDENTVLSADYIVDIGPGAGEHGGEIVVSGPTREVMKNKKSLTVKYLRGDLKIALPLERKSPGGRRLIIKGAKEHNLKNIDVEIPLGLFICVTGVSGSGKSSLVNDILGKALARELYKSRKIPGKHRKIVGVENIDKVIEVTQSAIGRTPRSNPATYIKMFDEIRKIYASVKESRIRGYKQGRFSFNISGGRCDACNGDGNIKIEMHFLPDVYIPCEVCKGKRYNKETLEITFKGKNISEVLEMSVEKALRFFSTIPKISKKLQTLSDVGLGYIKLGQPAPTLSGGEAQRVKLALELSKRSTGKTFYILDEPTTGLHFADVDKLLKVLKRLVEQGNTVLVIEHNLDVIKQSDHIIDLGP
ncbi:MAG: excinuclease ABC subunit UvrA, partial [Actinomycetia bacterium]|nr:excinuclease ABC subunit UvrA [Actinomycetes bacterium]